MKLLRQPLSIDRLTYTTHNPQSYFWMFVTNALWRQKKHCDQIIETCQFEENCVENSVKNSENLRRNRAKIHSLKIFFRMSFGLLSGDPSAIGINSIIITFVLSLCSRLKQCMRMLCNVMFYHYWYQFNISSRGNVIGNVY